MVIPGAVKLTFAVRVPLGLISHTAPTAHPAKVAPVSFRNVSSGFANVKVTPVYVPGITLAVFRNAASVSNCFTSMRTGPFPPSKSTLPGLNVAPVTLTSNDRNVNPLGGVSRIVTETAELPGGGALTASTTKNDESGEQEQDRYNDTCEFHQEPLLQWNWAWGLTGGLDEKDLGCVFLVACGL